MFATFEVIASECAKSFPYVPAYVRRLLTRSHPWTNRHDNELAEINTAADVKHEVHTLTMENERLRQVEVRLREASEMAVKGHLQTMLEVQESHLSKMDALRKAHHDEVQELKKAMHLAEQRLEICERGRAQELERWEREKIELTTAANSSPRTEDVVSSQVQGGHRLRVKESSPGCRLCALTSAGYGISSSPDDPTGGAKDTDAVLRALDAKVDDLLSKQVAGREEAIGRSHKQIHHTDGATSSFSFHKIY